VYGVDTEIFERIALTRLPELQTANGLFRATARVEGVEDEGRTPTTLRAGVVVLLGLLRAEEVELDQPFFTGALRTKVLGDLGGEEAAPGDTGLAMWAESRAGGGAVSEIHSLLKRGVAKGYGKVPLEELSWIVSGLTEATVRFGDEAGLTAALADATAALLGRCEKASGLFADVHRKRRGHLTPVSSQFHALRALSQVVRAGGPAEAEAATRALVEALVTLQREDGAWPGLVDPQRGSAVAIYPVLTVTQVALGPVALRAAGHQIEDSRIDPAITRALAWANGENALRFDLVHEQEARLDRGILPRREPGAVQRGFSTATRRFRGALQEPDPSRLILDPAVSSEDLGWLLEAWAGR
jgi:hypothetical protein